MIATVTVTVTWTVKELHWADVQVKATVTSHWLSSSSSRWDPSQTRMVSRRRRRRRRRWRQT
jgi:hypothetical protein